MMMVLQLQGCMIHMLVGLEQAPPHMLELLHRLKALQSQEHKWEQEQELGLEQELLTALRRQQDLLGCTIEGAIQKIYQEM